MKKVIVSAVLCGGVLMGMTSGLTAQAADQLDGKTTIGSEVIKGDITLKVNDNIDFGVKPLSGVVDFGTKEISYTVTDYTGTTNGFELSAKVMNKDGKRSLKIGDKELSEKAQAVVTEANNVVGENTKTVSSALKYTGIEKVQKYTSNVEWNLTKSTTKQISE
ncbi:TPA: hypothetical protein U2K93_001647 [Enterococcus faecalis]|nr:hypothetical protein [Enterococcus faecalis]HEM7729864.1 hypothetical protein [Enterococcus faecalis]